MKSRPLLTIAFAVAAFGFVHGSFAATTNTSLSNDPVKLDIRTMNATEIEVALSQLTPASTPRAEVEAILKDCLTHEHDTRYDDHVTSLPQGRNYLTKQFSQPLAVKLIAIKVGSYRSIFSSTVVLAYYFFDKDDHLLPVRVEKQNDAL